MTTHLKTRLVPDRGEKVKKILKYVIFILFSLFIALVALGFLIDNQTLPIAGLIVFAVASGLATIYLVLYQT
jgi:hypothetical protein